MQEKLTKFRTDEANRKRLICNFKTGIFKKYRKMGNSS